MLIRRRWPAPSAVTFLVTALLVAGLIPAGLVAVLRTARIERFQTVVLVETFTPLLAVPVLVVLATALLSRRWVLAAVAAVLMVAQLVWAAPELRRAGPRPACPAGTCSTLRLFDQNVLGGENRTPELLAARIRRTGPDVVLLQEAAAPFLAGLERTGALAGHQHRFGAPEHALAVYSRLPLADPRVVPTGPRVAVRADLDLGGRRVRLYAVHMPAPLYHPAASWLAAFRDLRRELASTDGPVVVAGDFNATWYHRPFRELVEDGFREAHQERGRGLARTWPARAGSLRRLGGVIRIDHVLVRGVGVAAISEQPASGSDHRGLLADLTVG